MKEKSEGKKRTERERMRKGRRKRESVGKIHMEREECRRQKKTPRKGEIVHEEVRRRETGQKWKTRETEKGEGKVR